MSTERKMPKCCPECSCKNITEHVGMTGWQREFHCVDAGHVWRIPVSPHSSPDPTHGAEGQRVPPLVHHEFPTIPDFVWVRYLAGQVMGGFIRHSEHAIELWKAEKSRGKTIGDVLSIAACDYAEGLLSELKKREGQDA